jgi:hypothetical protein
MLVIDRDGMGLLADADVAGPSSGSHEVKAGVRGEVVRLGQGAVDRRRLMLAWIGIAAP